MTGERRLSDAELAAIEERANAASPGPWHVLNATDEAPCTGIAGGPGFMWWPEECASPERDVADAAFLSAAREDVPCLVADLRAERAAHDVERAAVFHAGYEAGQEAERAETARLRAAAHEVLNFWDDYATTREPGRVALMAALAESEG